MLVILPLNWVERKDWCWRRCLFNFLNQSGPLAQFRCYHHRVVVWEYIFVNNAWLVCFKFKSFQYCGAVFFFFLSFLGGLVWFSYFWKEGGGGRRMEGGGARGTQAFSGNADFRNTNESLLAAFHPDTKKPWSYLPLFVFIFQNAVWDFFSINTYQKPICIQWIPKSFSLSIFFNLACGY